MNAGHWPKVNGSLEAAVESNAENPLDFIDSDGYLLLGGVSPDQAERILASLGRTLFVTNVTVRAGRALVTSDKALDLHTDHHRADLIAWHCIEQTDRGGETILLDSYNIVDQMAPNDVTALRQVNLQEHKVFEEDSGQFPMLSERFGRRKIYYSSWMQPGRVDAAARASLEQFRRLVGGAATPVRMKLMPGDLLLIDNGRLLHGRTAIEGNKRRLLKRYWIERKT